MPNHVTNVIVGAPEVIHALYKDDKVDFNLLIPEPENIETGGCSGTHPPDVVCWYTWHVDNWGTKWNGYSASVEALRGDLAKLRFDTAWSHPRQIIFELSRRFPDYELEVAYADEDLGGNLGRYTIKGGELLSAHLPDEYSDEANEMAAQLKYGRSYAEIRAEWDEDD